MGNTDYSVPHRMSLSAFIVIFIETLTGLVGPTLLIIAFDVINSDNKTDIAQTSARALIWLVIYFGIGLLTAFLAYYFKRFYIENGNLIVMHGWLHHQTTVIPLDKIQAKRTKQSFAYRILGMRSVSFDTLASKDNEVELILDEQDWKALISRIEQQEPISTDVQLPAKSADNLHFSNTNLLKGALCQNHLRGVLLLIGALFAVYDKFMEIDDKISMSFFGYLSKLTENVQLTMLNVVCIFLIIYVIGIVLWICKVYLRYYSMEVHNDKAHLIFKSGLVSRLSSSFSFDKISTITIKRNMVEKRLSCCTLHLRQAMNATAENRDFDGRIYGSNSSEFFLRWWLGAAYASSPVIISAKSGNGAFATTVMFDFLIALAVIFILYHFGLYTWLILPAVYIGISIIKGIFAKRRSSITLTESYVVINNGRFADIRNYVKYHNLEAVRLVRTPLTPIFHRINLVLSTNGATFTVRSLDERQANHIYELLLAR